MSYLFGGLALETDYTFDQLNDLGEPPPRRWLALDSSDAPPPPDFVVHCGNGRYRLTIGEAKGGEADGQWVFRSRFPDSFLFDPARATVACHIVSEDERAWQDVLFRRVLPRVAALYGATVVHAATIGFDDRRLLLLGPSGAGKSTLTAFCAKAGWQVLSDDTSVVWVDERIVAEPVQHGTGVWEDSRDTLGLSRADCVAMPGYGGGKWCFQPADAAPARAGEVSAVLVLDRSSDADAPALARLTRGEALQALLGQHIPFLPGAGPSAAAAASFGRVAAMARRLPAFRLTYPDGDAALPQVERLLRRLPLADGAG